MIEELATRPGAEADDPRRRYYRITALGLDVARLETARLERVVKMARRKKFTLRRA